MQRGEGACRALRLGFEVSGSRTAPRAGADSAQTHCSALLHSRIFQDDMSCASSHSSPAEYTSLEPCGAWADRVGMERQLYVRRVEEMERDLGRDHTGA